MEPGRKGREYSTADDPVTWTGLPQWSPAAKAGNTGRARTGGAGRRCLNGARPQRPGIPGLRIGAQEGFDVASMEPGRKGREYRQRSE